MKRCHACGEEFDSKFTFCPIDGNSLGEVGASTGYEYRLTLMSENSLAQRLAIEARFLFERCRRAWPQLKAHPITFTIGELRQFNDQITRFVARPYVARAALSSFGIISLVVLTVVLFDGRRGNSAGVGEPEDDLVPTMTLDLRDQPQDKSKPGVGAGEGGRVGFKKGSGEGSSPTPAHAQGGGGGGDLAQLPASQGRLPRPSEIPAPIPTTYAKLSQTLPDAGINIDPVLWKDLPFRDYGDPRSKSITPSNGPGNGGGVGNGEGQGVGDGKGTGVGPGNKNNMGGGDGKPGCCGPGGGSGNNPNPNNDIDRIFRGPEVTTRARVLSKPEPQYTEEARRSQISGTVVLSVVFSRTGEVTNIRAVQPLCCGLTEKAIAAARQIRFVPATREGKAVSTRMQLEYNFNLY
jgi:TonB family protein